MESLGNELHQKLITSYQSGNSARAVGALFGVSHRTCLVALKRAGIQPRIRGYAVRKHQLDETYFDNIDTEEKAYWLGFITADGCVYKSKLSIDLQVGDEEHLIKFQKSLGTTAPVRRGTRPERQNVVLEICSTRLVDSLAKLGIGERKSLTVEPWDGPDHLLRHYWRGVVDGDGWISPGSRRNGWRLGVCGSKAMIDRIQEIAQEICNTTASCYHKPPIWTFSVGGCARVRTFCNWLYADSTISLTRKKVLADTLKVLPDGSETRN